MTARKPDHRSGRWFCPGRSGNPSAARGQTVSLAPYFTSGDGGTNDGGNYSLPLRGAGCGNAQFFDLIEEGKIMQERIFVVLVLR